MLPALMPKPTSLEEQVVLVLVSYFSCLLLLEKKSIHVLNKQFKFLEKKKMHCTLKVMMHTDHFC